MVDVHVNPGAIEQLKNRPDLKAAVKKRADSVADRIRNMHIPVGDVDPDGFTNIIDIPVFVSDTPAVILAHPAGVAVQAKYGALTKGAGEIGLHVSGD